MDEAFCRHLACYPFFALRDAASVDGSAVTLLRTVFSVWFCRELPGLMYLSYNQKAI